MNRRITRRRLLGSAAALSAGGALVLAGCGEDPKRAAPGATPTSEPTAAPAASRGGVLRVYNFNAGIPDAFDPHLTAGGPVLNMHSAVFSKLLRYEDERAGTIVPDLGAAMPEQPDELTYIVRLREGVRFHDTPRLRTAHPAAAGRELDASDVKYGIERQLNRNSPQGNRFFRQSAWTVIDTIDVRDSRTLKITLKSPVAPFLAFLAGRHAFVVPREIVDRGTDEAAGDLAMIGSGPFMLESFEPGVVVRLRRNPAWFARDDTSGGLGGGRPFLDGYDAYYSPQEDTFQRAAFERRIVDMTGFTDPAAMDRARTTNLADIVVEETDGGGLLASRLLLDRAPFKDDRVRRAVHLAIDRRAMTDLLYPPMDGRPSAKLTGPIAPGFDRWALRDEDLSKRPGYRAERAEDLVTARQLWSAALADAPIGELRVFFAGVPRTIPERAVAALQRQLQDVLGATVVPQVDASGSAVIASALRRNVEGAAEGVVTFTFGIEDGGVDLDDWLHAPFRSGQPGNTYRLQDATLDALLDKQRGEFDAEERHKLGVAIQDYLLGKVNARIEIAAPVERRLAWGYVRNARQPAWHGSDYLLADAWLDSSHSAWAGRPA